MTVRQLLATFGARYLFGELHREELTLDTRLDLVLSPTLSIQVFAQPLISAGDYRTYAQLDRASSFDLARFTEGNAVELERRVRRGKPL